MDVIPASQESDARGRTESEPAGTGAVLDRLRAVPPGVWQRCPGCGCALHRDTWHRTAGTCPACGRTRRLSARQRMDTLVDPSTFVEHLSDLRSADPLGFQDSLPYPVRLQRARARTGPGEGAVVGTAEIGGRPAVVLAMDFGFLGGSMGAVIGAKVVGAADLALERGAPLVAVSCSGGARMQEGMYSLLQVARAAGAIRRLRERGVPYVSVLTDPVYGGVAASFAALGDVIIAESGSRSGFAGPRVIEQALGERLPEDFQTAEFLHRHGHIDLVVDRRELPGTVERVLSCLTRGGAVEPGPPAPGPAAPTRDRPHWEVVLAARDPGRPTVFDYVDHVFDDFVELHGDRHSEDDPALVGGVARWGAAGVVVLGNAKGAARNHGMAHPSGYRKATRLLHLAGRLGLPVVTFVDTPGAYAGRRAEEGNQSGAIAEALLTSDGVRVPVLTVVTGEGGSGGALALAAGDRLLITENSYFSVISPEGCAAILHGDAKRAPEAARALRLRAADLRAAGLVDEVVPEPPGGAQCDPVAAMRSVRHAIARHLAELSALSPDALLAQRDHRLRTRGVPADLVPAARPGVVR